MAHKHKSASSRGKRNRERGAELQRWVVSTARLFNLTANNRDRGGAQHEKGDVELEGVFFGCKRKKNIAQYILPEKEEWGVFVRADRKDTLVVIPAGAFLLIFSVFVHSAPGKKLFKDIPILEEIIGK